MKGIGVCVWLAALSCAALGDTIVGPRIIPSCSSSSKLIITVTGEHKPINAVRVDLYRRVENGERSYWSGLTGADGSVQPRELEPGEYRVFADAGERTGNMILVVGAFKGPTARCELKVGTPFSPEAGAPMPDDGTKITLKDFRGVVVDGKNVPIPRVIVTVVRSGEAPGHLTRIQADEHGRFDLHLDKGSYSAFFAYQGFRSRELFFHVSGDGWNGCELGLVAEDSRQLDPAILEWNAAF